MDLGCFDRYDFDYIGSGLSKFTSRFDQGLSCGIPARISASALLLNVGVDDNNSPIAPPNRFPIWTDSEGSHWGPRLLLPATPSYAAPHRKLWSRRTWSAARASLRTAPTV